MLEGLRSPLFGLPILDLVAVEVGPEAATRALPVVDLKPRRGCGLTSAEGARKRSDEDFGCFSFALLTADPEEEAGRRSPEVVAVVVEVPRAAGVLLLVLRCHVVDLAGRFCSCAMMHGKCVRRA